MIPRDRTFEIEGRHLVYPTEFRDGCSAAGLFLVKSKAANEYIADSGFELAEVVPGRGILVLTGVRYTDTDCGEYDETAMAFFVKRAGRKPRLPYASTWLDIIRGNTASFTWNLQVTTPLSRDAGIFMWGFPKTIEDIRYEQAGDRAGFNLCMDGQQVFNYSVRANGSTKPPPGHLRGVLDLGRRAPRELPDASLSRCPLSSRWRPPPPRQPSVGRQAACAWPAATSTPCHVGRPSIVQHERTRETVSNGSMRVRVAVVTGGASGLGRILALRMAAQGIRVAVVDRDREALAAAASESSNVHPVRCDVSSSEELGAALAEVESKLGVVDRMVTCAAIMPTSQLGDQETRDIQQVMAVNYGGTVNAVQAVLPAMVRRRAGELIIFGSTAARSSSPIAARIAQAKQQPMSTVRC